MTLPALGVFGPGFDDPREGHVHGALDICPKNRVMFKDSERDLFAIESGKMYAHKIRLETENRQDFSAWGMPWPAGEVPEPEPYPFANYTEEVYGICLLLLTEKRMYLYAHLNEVPGYLQSEDLPMLFKKESAGRWISAQFWGPVSVREGDYVGAMGWFGQTVPAGRPGCHLHIEAHEGRYWKPHSSRVRIDNELRRLV